MRWGWIATAALAGFLVGRKAGQDEVVALFKQAPPDVPPPRSEVPAAALQHMLDLVPGPGENQQ